MPSDPGYTLMIGWAAAADGVADGDCSGMIPPARTKTGIRSRGDDTVVVRGPLKVAPVKKSTHRPGGNHTLVSATSPGDVTGATSMSDP